jgi:hypothetical protein
MPYSGVNQWGPYTSAATDDDLPEYPPSATPQPTGDLTIAQSPSGVITGVQPVLNGPTSRMSPAAFNYDENESSTEWFLSEELQPESSQQGVAALTNSTQQIIAGVAASALQVFNWYGGSVGSVGNKFS